jgi:hypothetical protein
MKRIIIVLVVFFSTQTLKSQTDTLGIINNLVANKSHYINQPLSKLLNALGAIKVYNSSSIRPLKQLPDTLEQEYMNLYIRSNIVLKQDSLFPCFIKVRFIAPLQIPKYYFYEGNILDCMKLWNVKKQLYYSQFIISDFTIH